jgi:hypothetical protein
MNTYSYLLDPGENENNTELLGLQTFSTSDITENTKHDVSSDWG